VFSVPLSGGVPVVLADKQSIPWYIVLDGTNAYWTNYFGGSVVKVPLGGGTLVTLAVGQNQALGIAMDATHLYFTTDDGAGSGALLSLLK
jgi:hypothetical protein